MLKIKSLSLKNFKSIGENTQTIEFAPITLLFGPNGAGKSTVIQALAFLNEVINHRNYDPIKTEIGGDAMDLGGFLNLVHKKEKERSIEIGIGFDLEGNEINDLFIKMVPSLIEYQLEETIQDEDWSDVYFYREWLSSIYNLNLEFKISWDNKVNKVYIEEYKIWLNNTLFYTAISDNKLTKIQYLKLNHKSIKSDFVVSLAQKAFILQGINFYKSRIDNALNFKTLLNDEEALIKLSDIELYELVYYIPWLDKTENNELYKSVCNRITKELSNREIINEFYSEQDSIEYNVVDDKDGDKEIFNYLNLGKLMSCLYNRKKNYTVEERKQVISFWESQKVEQYIKKFPELKLNKFSVIFDVVFNMITDREGSLINEVPATFLDRLNELKDLIANNLFEKRLCHGFLGNVAIQEGILNKLEKKISEFYGENGYSLIEGKDTIVLEKLRETKSFLKSFDYGIDSNPNISILQQKDAMPLLDHNVLFDIKWKSADEIDDDDPHVKEYNRSFENDLNLKKNIFNNFLGNLITGPLILLSQLLDDLTYIGPLRDLPPREIKPQQTYDRSQWSKGLEAWNVLYKSEKFIVKEVNKWMDKNHIYTGYEVNTEHSLAMPKNKLKKLSLMTDIKKLKKQLKELEDNLPITTKLSLIDLNNNIPVMLQDIGVGISQLLPIIVLSCQNNESDKATQLVAIEQPELHIHPALQVELADLFISSSINKNKIFLIETHSEHLILRLLRRIRESVEKSESSKKIVKLKSSDVNVIYVEPSNAGSCLKQLRISKDGEFMDRWPRGFFEERYEELF